MVSAGLRYATRHPFLTPPRICARVFQKTAGGRERAARLMASHSQSRTHTA